MKLNVILLCFGFILLAPLQKARTNAKKLAGRKTKQSSNGLSDEMAEVNERKTNGLLDNNINNINTNPSAEKEFDTGVNVQGNKKPRRLNRQNRRKGKSQRKNKKQRKHKSKNNKEANQILKEDQKEKLRLTMREMFGFDHMTTPRANTQISSGFPEPTVAPPLQEFLDSDNIDSEANHQPHLPDFMLQLYRAYSEDSSLVLLNSMSRGNTIRSFFSVAGHPAHLKDQGRPVLIEPITLNDNETYNQKNNHHRLPSIAVYTYNVSTIPFAEKVVSAELRMDRTDVDQGDTNWTVLAAVYKRKRDSNNESLNLFYRVGGLTKINTTIGSAWTDVTLSSLVSLARQPDHVFVVKFSKLTKVDRVRRDAGNDLSDLPTNFKILKTKRPRRNSGKNRNNRATGYIWEDGKPAEIGVPILVVYCNDTSAVVQTPIEPIPNGIWDSMGNKSTSLRSTDTKRLRRSAKKRRPGNGSVATSSGQLDNQISDPSEPPRTLPIENDQTELHDNGQANRNVMQSLTTTQQKKNKRQKKKRCKKRGRRRKSKKCKKEKTKNNRNNLSESLNRSEKACSRKSLRVDFADLGWSDWIISPQQFDAYYCSGVCELESIRQHTPSNHAIIQSVIKEFELNQDIPSPCCVPDKMLSLSVLFFDKDESVVLKMYPGMSVESCACR